MGFAANAAGKRYLFDDLKTLLAKATPARSGDELAGIAARSATDAPLRRWFSPIFRSRIS